MGRTLIDLTGRSVGRWTVLGISHREPGGKATWWQCRCSCGSERAVRGSSLRHSRSTSCGCAQTNAERLKIEQREEGSSLVVPNAYLRAIAGGAANRRIPFSLDLSDLQSLLDKQNGKCALSGLPISFDWSCGVASVLSSSTTASLNRIRSGGGFELGNIQWIHKDVTFMKQRFGQGYFVRLCSRIAEHCTTTDTDLTDLDRGRTPGQYAGDRRDKSLKPAPAIPARPTMIANLVTDALRRWSEREQRGATAAELLASDLVGARTTPGTVRSYLMAAERAGEAHRRKLGSDDGRVVRWHLGPKAAA